MLRSSWLVLLLFAAARARSSSRWSPRWRALSARAPGVALRTGLASRRPASSASCCCALASSAGSCRERCCRSVLASMVLSMLATPFIIAAQRPHRDAAVALSEWMLQSLAADRIAAQSINAERHVIICGYGRSGQNLARMLEREKHAATSRSTSIPDRVRQAAAAGDTVVFGDAARREALMAAGLARAARGGGHLRRRAARRCACSRTCTSSTPRVPVIVRTHDDADLERLHGRRRDRGRARGVEAR